MQLVSLLCAGNRSVSVDYILAEYKNTWRKGGCSSTPDKIAGIPIQAQFNVWVYGTFAQKQKL